MSGALVVIHGTHPRDVEIIGMARSLIITSLHRVISAAPRDCQIRSHRPTFHTPAVIRQRNHANLVSASFYLDDEASGPQLGHCNLSQRRPGYSKDANLSMSVVAYGLIRSPHLRERATGRTDAPWLYRYSIQKHLDVVAFQLA